ncbi:MAG: phenylacetate-CoA oxygenase subunit PaaI, partial [Candidatus Kapabacteria bacterium]|nr:phenylacetate-CoA oxygenase subunit PaaI [Candidatus Kapabacteria bacterium]
MNTDALKDLLYRMADDALIYAHRNSEWTGLAPTLE